MVATGNGMPPLARSIFENIEQVIFGKSEEIRLLLAGLFAGGHLLLEDVPGTGKTILARALAKSIDAAFARIQFTPDLLPSDVTGISIFNEGTREFEFRKGPVFTEILLGDELNRTTPRTQSSLLEAMAEGQVTADGATYKLPPLFFVLATQNPIEQQGVYHLPEAQLDRFLMLLSLGYPDLEAETRMLSAQRDSHPIESIEAVAAPEDVLAARTEVKGIHIEDDVANYIVRLVNATRNHTDLLLGGSPRASLGLSRSAQALAWLNGRTFVLPDDIKAVATPVLRHRLILKPQTRLSGVTSETIIRELLAQTEVPISR